MPEASRLSLAPLSLSDETPAERLARIRRQRGFTQSELGKTGLIQTLVSDYKRRKLRLKADMVVRTIDTLLENAALESVRP
jgi:transcriptional regulator with XRE-family HTH domain